MTDLGSYTLFLTRLSVGVGIGALICTVVALFMIRAQIVIANKQLLRADTQLDRADRQLDLAEKELKLVGDDLALSQENTALVREQMADSKRRPKLTLVSPDSNDVLHAY